MHEFSSMKIIKNVIFENSMCFCERGDGPQPDRPRHQCTIGHSPCTGGGGSQPAHNDCRRFSIIICLVICKDQATSIEIGFGGAPLRGCVTV